MIRADQRVEVLIPEGGFDGLHLPLAVVRHEGKNLLPLPVVNALEFLSRTDRPVHRDGADAQLLLDFIQQVKRVAGFAVHFIDKGKYRDMPHHADLEQLAGLVFHALAGVDYHHGGIGRHQGAVGILRKILVARGIQNIDAVAVVMELHHRGGNRDAALLFDLHPVGDGVLGGLFSLDRAGERNRASVQQELFGQGGFPRVGVGDDGEGAALFDFLA